MGLRLVAQEILSQMYGKDAKSTSVDLLPMLSDGFGGGRMATTFRGFILKS